jgi:hypothetical protein
LISTFSLQIINKYENHNSRKYIIMSLYNFLIRLRPLDTWFFKSRFRDLYFIFQIPVSHDAPVNTFNFKWEKNQD